MANLGDLKLNLVIDCKISLWQAIKLRIAGKNFKIIAEGVLKEVKKNLDISKSTIEDTRDECSRTWPRGAR